MADKPLQVDGKQSDYNLQMVETDFGQTPVLMGVAGQAYGEIHHLEGARAIQFKDGLVDLLQTSLASEPVEKTFLPSSPTEALDANQSVRNSETEPQPQAEQARDIFGSGRAVSASQYADGVPDAAQHLNEQTVAQQADTDPDSSESAATPEIDAQSMVDANAAPRQSAAPTTNAKPLDASAAMEARLPQRGSESADMPALAAASQLQIPAIREIFGTSGPDRLIGTSGADRIDGMANFDLTNGSFDELLMGLDGDDLLFYRGFLGEFDADSMIRARLFGGAGNDQITVALDQVSAVEIDGGPGIDQLILDPMRAGFDPWSAQFMTWHWDFAGIGPTLVGKYSSPLHPNAGIVEATPSIDLISTSSGSAMQLVRPQSEQETALIGSSQSDLLIASAATSFIDAGAGNDIVVAQLGNTVQLGAGINTLYSTDPDITLSYEDSPYSVDVDLSTRLGIVFDSADSIYSIDRLMSAVKNLTGSSGNDRLVGDSQDNIIRTGGGSDTLIGGGGADHFILDLDPEAGATRILDFSLEQGDSVSLNLSALDLSADLPAQDPFFSFLISDAAGNTVHQGLVNQSSIEEGAILQLQLLDQDSTLYWVRPDTNLSPLVDLFVDLNEFDQDQWNQFLSVDYL